ncbi:copper resistance protein CopC [Bacillus gobiensis]|uniref:copper resistance protein CopC n=1 Tax=Bacillus gobiensis TaxID=1441095 RepID=UPI003D219300
MKKILAFTLVLLLANPSLIFAHSTLENSTPENGAVIEEPLKEITLHFNTPIENLSTMTLSRESEEIDLENQKVEGSSITGTLNEPLQSGEYTVSWKIVGEDGHTVEDSIGFSVNVSEKNQDAEGQDDQTNAQTDSNDTGGQGQNAYMWIGIIALLFAAGIYLLTRKKK